MFLNFINLGGAKNLYGIFWLFGFFFFLLVFCVFFLPQARSKNVNKYPLEIVN